MQLPATTNTADEFARFAINGIASPYLRGRHIQMLPTSGDYYPAFNQFIQNDYSLAALIPYGELYDYFVTWTLDAQWVNALAVLGKLPEREDSTVQSIAAAQAILSKPRKRLIKPPATQPNLL